MIFHFIFITFIFFVFQGKAFTPELLPELKALGEYALRLKSNKSTGNFFIRDFIIGYHVQFTVNGF